MKTAILALGLLALATAAQAQPAVCVVTRAHLPPDAPRFEAYPARASAPAKPAEVNLAGSVRARMFRTQLRTQQLQGPNFAGGFRLATWGCGADCIAFAVIDQATGRVAFTSGLELVTRLPDRYEDALLPVIFQKDSRMLITAGAPDEDETRSGVTYYAWSGRGLKQLRHYSYAELCAHRTKN